MRLKLRAALSKVIKGLFTFKHCTVAFIKTLIKTKSFKEAKKMSEDVKAKIDFKEQNGELSFDPAQFTETKNGKWARSMTEALINKRIAGEITDEDFELMMKYVQDTYCRKEAKEMRIKAKSEKSKAKSERKIENDKAKIENDKAKIEKSKAKIENDKAKIEKSMVKSEKRMKDCDYIFENANNISKTILKVGYTAIAVAAPIACFIAACFGVKIPFIIKK